VKSFILFGVLVACVCICGCKTRVADEEWVLVDKTEKSSVDVLRTPTIIVEAEQDVWLGTFVVPTEGNTEIRIPEGVAIAMSIMILRREEGEEVRLPVALELDSTEGYADLSDLGLRGKIDVYVDTNTQHMLEFFRVAQIICVTTDIQTGAILSRQRGRKFLFKRTEPVVTVQHHLTKLAPGARTEVVSGFTVSAHPRGDLELRKMTFKAVGLNASASNYRLRRIGEGGTVDFPCTADEEGVVEVYFGDPDDVLELVQAGTTNRYQLVADVVATGGESWTDVSILSDNNSIDVPLESAEGWNFVWSDRATSGMRDEGRVYWANGYGVSIR